MSKLEAGWYVTWYRITPAHWYGATDKGGRVQRSFCGMCCELVGELSPASRYVRHCKTCERAKRKVVA